MRAEETVEGNGKNGGQVKPCGHVGDCWHDEQEQPEAPPKRLDQSSIDSPPHYQANGVEAIDVIEAFELGFSLGNAVKYILRAGRKGPEGMLHEKEIEDLRKARWHLERRITRLGGGQ